MNPEQENFDQLRRLLKLKRYEQPPPRYFNDFSSQIITRIEKQRGPATWLPRLWTILQTRPIIPGAVAATVCAVLVLAAVQSERPDNTAALASEKLPVAPVAVLTALRPPGEHLALVSSTNPVVQIPGSLFDQVAFQNPVRNVMPAAYRIGFGD